MIDILRWFMSRKNRKEYDRIVRMETKVITAVVRSNTTNNQKMLTVPLHCGIEVGDIVSLIKVKKMEVQE